MGRSQWRGKRCGNSDRAVVAKMEPRRQCLSSGLPGVGIIWSGSRDCDGGSGGSKMNFWGVAFLVMGQFCGAVLTEKITTVTLGT